MAEIFDKSPSDELRTIMANTNVPDYNGIVSSLAQKASQHLVNVTDAPYNVKGDGTDETTAMQSALDYASSNNKVFYVPSYITVAVSNLAVTSKSNFGIRVEGTIKFINSAPANATILKLDTCNDVDIYSLNGDANVANNGVTINEQLHVLRLLNSNRVYIGKVTGKNPTGDVVYINNCTDIIVDKIYGYGNNTGRNTLSIVKGSRMEFSNVISIGVGTEIMPCGVDLEPNFSTDSITDIQFGNVYVEGIGTGSFSMYNNFGADCRNITVSNLIANKITPPVENRKAVMIDRFNNVKITMRIREKNTSANLMSLGLYVNGGDNIDLDVDISNVSLGVLIGQVNTVTNLNLKGTVYNCRKEGVNITLLSNSNLRDLKVYGGDLLNTGTGYFNLRLTSTANVSNVNIKNCDFSKTSGGWRAVQMTGTISNVLFEDCDFSGWASLSEMFSGTYTGVFRRNNKSLNYMSAPPTAYYWSLGEIIWNTAPVASGIMGWVCTTAGTVGSGAVFKTFGTISA